MSVSEILNIGSAAAGVTSANSMEYLYVVYSHNCWSNKTSVTLKNATDQSDAIKSYQNKSLNSKVCRGAIVSL